MIMCSICFRSGPIRGPCPETLPDTSVLFFAPENTILDPFCGIDFCDFQGVMYVHVLMVCCIAVLHLRLFLCILGCSVLGRVSGSDIHLILDS